MWAFTPDVVRLVNNSNIALATDLCNCLHHLFHYGVVKVVRVKCGWVSMRIKDLMKSRFGFGNGIFSPVLLGVVNRPTHVDDLSQ